MKVFLNFSVKRYLLLFCIILSLPIVMQAQSDESDLASQLKYLGLAKIGNKYSPANTTFVLKLWDSLNNYHHDKMYDLLPANEWEKILNNFYLKLSQLKMKIGRKLLLDSKQRKKSTGLQLKHSIQPRMIIMMVMLA